MNKCTTHAHTHTHTHTHTQDRHLFIGICFCFVIGIGGGFVCVFCVFGRALAGLWLGSGRALAGLWPELRGGDVILRFSIDNRQITSQRLPLIRKSWHLSRSPAPEGGLRRFAASASVAGVFFAILHGNCAKYKKWN